MQNASAPIAGGPTFLVIGAAKSGTSSLWHYLMENPVINSPRHKEPRYFRNSHNHTWLDCSKPLRFYPHRLTPFVKDYEAAPILGDFSVMNMPCHCCPHLFKLINPSLKIIALLRNPVERAVSHFYDASDTIWHRGKPLTEHTSFREYANEQINKAIVCLQSTALTISPNSSADDYITPEAVSLAASRTPVNAAMRAALETQCMADAGGVGWSAYAPLLENWLAEFTPAQLLVVYTHELKAAPREVLHRVESFLGAPHHDYSEELLSQGYHMQARHGISTKTDLALLSSMSRAVQREEDASPVQKFLEPYTERLRQMADAGLIRPPPPEFYAYP